MTLRRPLRIRITIEYDPDPLDGYSEQDVLSAERADWMNGRVNITDLDQSEVKFEVIP